MSSILGENALTEVIRKQQKMFDKIIPTPLKNIQRFNSQFDHILKPTSPFDTSMFQSPIPTIETYSAPLVEYVRKLHDIALSCSIGLNLPNIPDREISDDELMESYIQLGVEAPVDAVPPMNDAETAQIKSAVYEFLTPLDNAIKVSQEKIIQFADRHVPPHLQMALKVILTFLVGCVVKHGIESLIDSDEQSNSK